MDANKTEAAAAAQVKPLTRDEIDNMRFAKDVAVKRTANVVTGVISLAAIGGLVWLGKELMSNKKTTVAEAQA